jgi:hypothetical protein
VFEQAKKVHASDRAATVIGSDFTIPKIKFKGYLAIFRGLNTHSVSLGASQSLFSTGRQELAQ